MRDYSVPQQQSHTVWHSLAEAEVLQLCSPGIWRLLQVVAAVAVSVVELGILFVVAVSVAEAAEILQPNHTPANLLGVCCCCCCCCCWADAAGGRG